MGEINKGIQGTLIQRFDPDSPYADNPAYQNHVFEQYKLYIEMADRISARRQTASSFFLSINTAMIGFLSYLHVGKKLEGVDSLFWLIAISGIAICYLWYRIIRSYRDLNTAKFKVVHEIEQLLPLSPYDAEWEAVGRGKRPDLYLPFTHIETAIPWVFLLLHFVVLVQSFPWDIFSQLTS